jgi:hypothetical protein
MVVIYGICLDPWLLFAAKACALNNVSARLIISELHNRQSDSDEQDCLKWLAKYPTISLEYLKQADLGTLTGDTCFVVLRGNYGHDERKQITQLVSRFSRRIGLVRLAADSKTWQLKQILREFSNPYYSFFTEIWSEDSRLSLIRAVLGKPHRYYGALPHQRCTAGKEDWDLLASAPPVGSRPCLFSWAGTYNLNRESIIHWVEERLTDDGQHIDLRPVAGRHEIIWHNDVAGTVRVRNYNEYIKELEMAWFCLCLPGFTGTTNRLLESILRGSIPVLQVNQLPYYDLPLVDAVNCIVVKGGTWGEAINRIALIPNAERIRMQSAVVDLAQTFAQLTYLSKRLCAAIVRNNLP